MILYINLTTKKRLNKFSLKTGESVIFDPDLVGHGMKNQSKTETRYSLIQVFKAYPVTSWLTDFINKEQTINYEYRFWNSLSQT